MTNFIKASLLGATLATLLLPAVAQTTSSAPAQTGATPATNAPATGTTPAQTPQPNINQRKTNQQDRIGNDIDNGSLTKGEAGNLEGREADLNQEEKNMRKLNNGHLTAADRATLQQQQNKLSNQIHNDAHNANTQTTHPATEVGKREQDQQQHIASGVQDGQLSANQASKLENKEAGINQEVKSDRAANGGKLTAAEKQQVTKQQNGVAYQVHHEKQAHKTKTTK
jgi:hypothetical protein